jgi:hypothetical protein
MRMKRPRVASLDEVHISRRGEYAIIEFADSTVSTTQFKLGPEVMSMSDEEILERFNASMRARDELMAEHEHVAVEVPIGRPQIEFFERGRQWTPRGGVLRCVIDDGGPEGEPVIHIDEHELSWGEFGRMLTTYAGWGMRIVFVPDDEIHEEPQIEVREPDEGR